MQFLAAETTCANYSRMVAIPDITPFWGNVRVGGDPGGHGA